MNAFLITIKKNNKKIKTSAFKIDVLSPVQIGVEHQENKLIAIYKID